MLKNSGPATGKAIAFFAGLYAFLVAAILPRAEQRLKAASGGTGPIDLRFTYTPDEAYSMVETYGEEGRRFYAMLEVTMDVVYPFTYASLFSLLIAAGFRRGLRPDHPLQRAHRVPYAVMLVDFAENVGIVTMLLRYPTRHPRVARLTALFTLAKWLGFGVTVLLTLTSLGLTAARLLTSRTATSRS
ncbi:MAG TPA: hypothetical protein VER55_11140 [Ardenticatenaceae bacterium]|nr:hypothetical protein [Ardenticatenaceae bacterium]